MHWFLPEGVPRPDHLPPSAQVGAVSVVAGPSGGPGHVIGGVYLLSEPGWVALPSGWWINAVGSCPSRLLRLDARDGVEIPGADSHRWLVPHLFRPLAGGLVWAGEQRLGPMGWSVPPPPEPWQSVGLAIRDHLQAGDLDKLEEDEVTAMALPLLCSNYHLLPCELIAAEWLTRSMLPAIFAATFGAN